MSSQTASVIKYSAIVLSFLTAVFLWRYSIDRRDGAILALAMLLTVITDVFLVLLSNQHITGMAFYGLTMTVYFFRYQNSKRAVILPFFLIIPLVLHFAFRLESLIVITSYYIQVLLVNIFSAIQCVRRGKYPKKNAVLILSGLFLFLLGDISVVLLNFFGIAKYRKFIWLFYAPSQAMLAFSANDFEKDKRLVRELALELGMERSRRLRNEN